MVVGAEEEPRLSSGADRRPEGALAVIVREGKVGRRPQELGPEDMLALRTGFTVADASSLFDTAFKREDLVECGCNMHARRYFMKALDAGDTRAALPIAAYKKLYEIESDIAELAPGEKLERRRFAPIVMPRNA